MAAATATSRSCGSISSVATIIFIVGFGLTLAQDHRFRINVYDDYDQRPPAQYQNYRDERYQDQQPQAQYQGNQQPQAQYEDHQQPQARYQDHQQPQAQYQDHQQSQAQYQDHQQPQAQYQDHQQPQAQYQNHQQPQAQYQDHQQPQAQYQDHQQSQYRDQYEEPRYEQPIVQYQKPVIQYQKPVPQYPKPIPQYQKPVAPKKKPKKDEQDFSKIPGVPGIDFPIYHTVPKTSFSCAGVPYLPGMYANIETGCQAYHVCHDGREGDQGASFLCSNGTLFNQKEFACDWWYNVNCANAHNSYRLNGDATTNPFVPKAKKDEILRDRLKIVVF